MQTTRDAIGYVFSVDGLFGLAGVAVPFLWWATLELGWVL